MCCSHPERLHRIGPIFKHTEIHLLETEGKVPNRYWFSLPNLDSDLQILLLAVRPYPVPRWVDLVLAHSAAIHICSGGVRKVVTLSELDVFHPNISQWKKILAVGSYYLITSF